MPKRPDALIRSFGMTGYQITADIEQIEKDHEVELGHIRRLRKRRQLENYDQFEKDVRAEASLMSEYYEIFYCLEKSIRKLIVEVLEDAEGEAWWSSSRVPAQLRTDIAQRQAKELDNGISVRSDEEIDYTTFGELLELIIGNWDRFEPIFGNKKAVQKIIPQLNLLRGPIAHCSLLSEDEVLRLELAVRDWFRILS